MLRLLFAPFAIFLAACGGGRECPEGWLESVDGEPCVPTAAYRREVEQRLGTGLFGMASILCPGDGDDMGPYGEAPGPLARRRPFAVSARTDGDWGAPTGHRTTAAGTWEIALPPGSYLFSERAFVGVRAVDDAVSTEHHGVVDGLDRGEVAFVLLDFPGRCD